MFPSLLLCVIYAVCPFLARFPRGGRAGREWRPRSFFDCMLCWIETILRMIRDIRKWRSPCPLEAAGSSSSDFARSSPGLQSADMLSQGNDTRNLLTEKRLQVFFLILPSFGTLPAMNPVSSELEGDHGISL